jgi:hypothetical protein
MKGTMIAAILCISMGAVSALDLSLSLKGDTFLPYEPIYARLDVSNNGTTAIELPQINNFSIDYVFDFTVVATPSQRLKLRLRMADPSWYMETLPAGASAHAVTDLTRYASGADPSPRGTFCYRPGAYAVSARRGGVVSNTVTFAVREPTGGQQEALRLYRELVYYRDVAYWGRLGEPNIVSPIGRVKDKLRRTEDRARKIIRFYPRSPYAFLAERSLAWDYHSRVSGSYREMFQSSPQSGNWRDSTRAIYARVLSAHPDSPVAEHMLCYERLPEVFGDSAYTRTLLQGLSAAHPGTLVGIEAARQLKLLAKSSADMK